MKLISGPAMTAIEAGEVIVTGAVEIIPQASIYIPPVPTGTNAVELKWWQQSYTGDTPPDQGRMGLAFYDVDGVHLGSTVWSPYASPATWTQYTLTATAPGGTVTTRVYQGHKRNSGAANDSYIDDITLSVGGAPVTLVNPGAETVGAVGWTIVTGTIYSASPGRTTTVSFGSTEALAVAYQDVTVSVDPAVPPPPPGDPIRLWGGYGTINLDGDDYIGVGDRALAQQTNGALGSVAQGLSIGLSGIEPIVLEMMDVVGIRGASVVLRRLIFASDGRTLLDYAVWDRGRVDVPDMDETVGGAASITLAVESAARGLGHSGARQRSDSDQRLISATDGYFKHTAYAGQKTLYWGGKKPAIGMHGGSGWGIALPGSP